MRFVPRCFVLRHPACAVLGLPHGRWLLFTLASVSLPYADDVPAKMKKRILATITGGILSVVIYSLIPSPAGRTAAMMLSGYLSFYFTDYRETFACSTIGALGGAVFMNSFGFQAVGSMFLIRLGYILAGQQPLIWRTALSSLTAAPKPRDSSGKNIDPSQNSWTGYAAPIPWTPSSITIWSSRPICWRKNYLKTRIWKSGKNFPDFWPCIRKRYERLTEN